MVGFIYSTKKFNYLPLLYIFSLFPVEIFSYLTPDAARGVHILPLIFSFIAIGISFLISRINNKNIIEIVVMYIFIYSIISNINIYFEWITKKSTLESRRPAIINKDFKLWYTKMEKETRNGGWGFNVGGWEVFINDQPKVE